MGVSEDTFGVSNSKAANQNAQNIVSGVTEGEGWARAASRDEQLQEDAQAFFPPFPRYLNTMNRDLALGFYSDSLLNAYKSLSEANPNNIYVIQPIEGTNLQNRRYEIVRLNTTDGQVAVGLGIPTVVTESIKNELSRINKGRKATGWEIKTPNSEGFSPVYMPNLTILGRRINNLLGESTALGSDLQSAQEGFNTIYTELLSQGYEFKFTGQRDTGRDATSDFQFQNDPQVRSTTQGLDVSTAVVYKAGGKEYAYKDLQPGRSGVTPFRGNEEYDFNQLKKTVDESGVLDSEGVREEFNAIQNLQDLEAFVENEVNPNIPDPQRKIMTPTRYEEGRFFESDTGDFVPLSPEKQRNEEYKAATFTDLGTPAGVRFYTTKSRGPLSVDQTLVDRLGETNTVEKLNEIARDKFKLKKNVKVFAADRDFVFTDLEKRTDVESFRFLQEQQEVLNNSTDGGRFISLGKENIILIKISENAGSAEKGAAILSTAHEFGHAFFEQEVTNSLDTELGKKIYAAFEKARNAPGAPEIYQEGNPHAYEEFFSDQIGVFLLAELRNEKVQAKNGVESYFKRIAKQLADAFKALGNEVRTRFTVNPDFSNYIQTVIKSYKDGTADPNRGPAAYQDRRYARAMVDGFVPKTYESAAQRTLFKSLKKAALDILEDPSSRSTYLKKTFYTADNFLKGLSKEKGIGKELAAIFYTSSQSEGGTGLLTANIVKANSEVNKLSAILELDDVSQITPEAEAILLEAENDTIPTEQLGEKAKQVREWLSDFYDRENLGAIFNNRKIENYFPRLIAIAEITENVALQDSLVNLIVQNNPNTTEQVAREVVQGLIAEPANALIEGNETDGEGRFNIGLAKERAALFKNISTKDLRDAILLEEPAVAVRKYLSNSIKRSEFNKRGGAKKVQELVDQLPEKEQGHAIDAIDAIMGRVNPNMGANFRFINSWGLVANITTLLAFAVFASLPDFAGPILRSKEFSAFGNFGRELGSYFQNSEEASRFAKDIGVVSTDAINTMYINAGELDFMGKNAKLVSEKFFKYTGLEWYTRFTRIFAAGMGRRFLMEHQMRADQGDARSQRYLRELGVTSAQIKTWNNSQNVEAHPEVKLALAQFVDESIVRPNAAERPVWASDPRLALVWQLKSFFYAYGKNIVGGVMRESSSRVKEGAGMNSATLPLLLAASTLLPLSMLGLDLRERFKVGLAWALPGVSPEDKNYRKSLDMEWDKYSFEIIDRSGVFGPWALAAPLFMQSKRYGDPFWISPLGPSVEKGYDLLTGDLDFKDITPIYNQI